jgi:hypothetical protein
MEQFRTSIEMQDNGQLLIQREKLIGGVGGNAKERRAFVRSGVVKVKTWRVEDKVSLTRGEQHPRRIESWLAGFKNEPDPAIGQENEAMARHYAGVACAEAAACGD